MNASAATANAFVFIRTFNSPRDVVWKAWTDRAARTLWWQPMGSPIKVKTYDVKPGGIMHYGMDLPDGGEWWGRFAYREVEAPSRLVYLNSFSDENGGVVRASFNKDWPLEILTTVTFTDNGGNTLVKMEGVPLNPTNEERAVFEGALESMQQAFSGTFGQLETYLASH